MPLSILHLDSDLAVIAKPSGLLVHPSPLARGAPSCLKRLRDQLGKRVYPVHRLDRATSGVLAFALSPEVASQVGACFREERVRKVYHAVVRGIAPERGEIDKPLSRADGKEPRPAFSRFERVAEIELPHAVGKYETARYSLVRVETSTGRLHQVRLHLRSINHPLIGDTVHGDGAHNRFFREQFGSHRLLLHATRLEWPGFACEAPWPDELAALFVALGWQATAEKEVSPLRPGPSVRRPPPGAP